MGIPRVIGAPKLSSVGLGGVTYGLFIYENWDAIEMLWRAHTSAAVDIEKLTQMRVATGFVKKNNDPPAGLQHQLETLWTPIDAAYAKLVRHDVWDGPAARTFQDWFNRHNLVDEYKQYLVDRCEAVAGFLDQAVKQSKETRDALKHLIQFLIGYLTLLSVLAMCNAFEGLLARQQAAEVVSVVLKAGSRIVQAWKWFCDLCMRMLRLARPMFKPFVVKDVAGQPTFWKAIARLGVSQARTSSWAVGGVLWGTTGAKEVSDNWIHHEGVNPFKNSPADLVDAVAISMIGAGLNVPAAEAEWSKSLQDPAKRFLGLRRSTAWDSGVVIPVTIGAPVFYTNHWWDGKSLGQSLIATGVDLATLGPYLGGIGKVLPADEVVAARAMDKPQKYGVWHNPLTGDLVPVQVDPRQWRAADPARMAKAPDGSTVPSDSLGWRTTSQNKTVYTPRKLEVVNDPAASGYRRTESGLWVRPQAPASWTRSVNAAQGVPGVGPMVQTVKNFDGYTKVSFLDVGHTTGYRVFYPFPPNHVINMAPAQHYTPPATTSLPGPPGGSPGGLPPGHPAGQPTTPSDSPVTPPLPVTPVAPPAPPAPPAPRAYVGGWDPVRAEQPVITTRWHDGAYDSLWDIARKVYGDPRLYTHIADDPRNKALFSGNPGGIDSIDADQPIYVPAIEAGARKERDGEPGR
ncbi:hypothetical protein GCM10027176_79430 [Actinoallomurus bryophytorum]|uniref:Uncharacterized protein n=1 Tax=Actinoallomurus bryophytorum TaxID=1490222 RepID=A0A543C0P3_9ACTN|nr:hypothetical protein [Actinoallomurus bryophytorum]TQL90651.1 hypothetical protein FB559_7961 [Actinoallomurus bryophytorum]